MRLRALRARHWLTARATPQEIAIILVALGLCLAFAVFPN